MLLAKSFTQFLPPLTGGQAVALAAAAAAVALLGMWLLGRPNPVARNWGLLGLRAAIVGLVVLVLANPVIVDELPGPMKRPEVFYLLDASASMQMGNPRSRWDDSLALIRAAGDKASTSPAIVKPFRFGQRLAAIDRPDAIGIGGAAAPPLKVTTASNAPVKTVDAKPVLPLDGDTRLQSALRQISSRFGRVPPEGIVVFSDGRVHDDAGLAEIAAGFKQLQVPIHVAPLGSITGSGDVAVAAVVAPPRVRKFTEVEVQVFVRCAGYEGQRTEVQLWEIEGNREGRKLASLPITLQADYQSVSLAFRSDLSTRKLRISIPVLDNEVSDKNNRLDTEIQIDRTKIRVLYVEGSAQPLQAVRVGDRYQYRGPFTDLKQALTEDEDVECVVLAAPGGIGPLARIAEYSQVDGVRGFPTTVAELAAFDAIILSDVAAEAFTDKQLQWIDQWIGQRGGGLCMVGGEHSFASGGWDQTSLANMLPVEMQPGSSDWMPGEAIQLAPELPASPHPLWTLVADEKQNRKIVTGFPQVLGMNRWAGARPNLTTVLATTSVSGSAVPAAAPRFSLRALSSVLQDVGSQDVQPSLAAAADSASVPAIVAGRYGRGRTMAVAFPITSPHADELVQKWGISDNRYYSKFARNLVYWLTETSAIGRRRLVAMADKRFYRPGETITVQAATYDESASPTKNYRVTAMVEPHDSGLSEIDSDNTPLKWPVGRPRDSGEEGQYLVWGEEFELPLGGVAAGGAAASGEQVPLHAIQLPLADTLSSGSSSQSMRIELTAWEDQTQVDSTSLDIQVLHDPFEQQNPFPNHDLLKRIAAASGGSVISTPEQLARVLSDVPVSVGPPIVKRSPLWSGWWMWALIVGLLTIEWCWRRGLGLA